jgi:hypothetical protein
MVGLAGAGLKLLCHKPGFHQVAERCDSTVPVYAASCCNCCEFRETVAAPGNVTEHTELHRR